MSAKNALIQSAMISPEYYHKTLASFFGEHNCFLACETTKAWQKLLQF